MPTNPGTANLISYWALDESSGSRADSHGSKTLTDNNTVGSTTGVQGNAARLVEANTEYLSRADDADLRFTGGDRTICGWVRVNGTHAATVFYIVSKWDSSFQDWAMSGTDATGALGGGVRNAADTGDFGATDSGANLTDGSWHFVAMIWDATAEEISVKADGRARVTTSAPGGVSASSAAMEFGRLQQGFGPSADIDLDEWALFSAALSDDELAWLYNSGAGRTYAELAGGSAVATIMQAHWAQGWR